MAQGLCFPRLSAPVLLPGQSRACSRCCGAIFTPFPLCTISQYISILAMPEIPHLTSIPYLPCHLLTPTCLLIRLSCHCRHALKRRFLLEQCLCRRATACVATFPIVFTFAKACSRHCAFVVAKKKLFLPMPVAFYTQLLHAVASKETC